MIRVHVQGAKGRMGSTVVSAVEAAADMELTGTSDLGDDLAAALAESSPDVAVEFTTPDAVEQSVRTMLEAGVHVVSGTTGLPCEQAQALGEVAAARELGFLLAPNFSISTILLQRFAGAAARHFADVEIIELHHERKLDAPSGTAIHTARLIAEAAPGEVNPGRPDETETIPGCRGGKEAGIPIHSVRLPGLLAHQEVIFGAQGQLLTLRQDTLDREAFMPGVLLGIRKIHEHRGLIDSLEHLLDD